MCNCKHNDNGMGALAAAYGLRGITDPVRIGAPFSLGVELTSWASIDDFVDEEALRRALASSGYVQASVQVYQMAGVFNPFVVVEGHSGREYGSATHLRDAVLSVIQSQYTIDPASIRFEATTYNPQTQAQTIARYDAQTGGAQYAPRVPAGSNSFSGIFDSIAGSLGVTRSQAVLIGAGGAILGVVLLKRLI